MSTLSQQQTSLPYIISSSTQTYPKWMFWKERRYTLAVLGFFGFCNAYALRTNLSIAVVAMTGNKSVIWNNETLVFAPEFDWNSKVKGYVLSSFFYGYITTQFVGGLLSARIGGSRLFVSSIAGSAVLTLFIPWAANTNVYLLIFIRALMGALQGVIYPCVFAISSRWIPPLERTKLLALMGSGCHVGTIVSVLFGGCLTKTFGWPTVFYTFGFFTLIWSVIWWLVVAESPADDPAISLLELELIRGSLGNIAATKYITHPWREILTSGPVWAIIIANFADDWGFYILLTELPTFMDQMFHYDLNETGIISSLPWITMAFTINLSGQLIDWLRQKNMFSTASIRKMSTCIALVCNAIFISAAAFWLNPVGTIILLVLAGAVSTFSFSGYGVNILDVAPEHSSIIIGLSNSAGCLGGIFSPILTGYIVTTPTQGEWLSVFCISGFILIFGSVVYILWGSGELQEWAVEPKTRDRASSEVVIYYNGAFEGH